MTKVYTKKSVSNTVIDEIKTLVSHLEELPYTELVIAMEVLHLELDAMLNQVEVVIELSEANKKTFRELISSK